MDLGDRKKLILKAIIEDYISTAEPVGSRTISKKYLTDVSSATIRNEMADLEEMGYIEQPHTSSGRIPSQKAYRLYVDNLIKGDSIEKHVKLLNEEFKDTLGEIDNLVRHASKLLSQLTNYTAIVSMPQLNLVTLKKIQLIKIDCNTLLAVMVTDAGMVKNSAIRIKEEVSESLLYEMNEILNYYLVGRCIEDINEETINYLIMKMGGRNEIVQQVIVDLMKALQVTQESDIHHEGAANMLSLPEFKDVSKARDFFHMLDEKETLLSIINGNDTNDLIVAIGNENKIQMLSDCSVITATYKVNGKIVGTIGVVGPTRMEYSKVISVVDSVRDNMTEMLNEILNLNKK